VAVPPYRIEGVATDRIDSLEIAVGVHEAALPTVALAGGTWAPAAEIRERIFAHVRVTPLDLQDAGLTEPAYFDRVRRARHRSAD
jgi:hypothetical protein